MKSQFHFKTILIIYLAKEQNLPVTEDPYKLASLSQMTCQNTLPYSTSLSGNEKRLWKEKQINAL